VEDFSMLSLCANVPFFFSEREFKFPIEFHELAFIACLERLQLRGRKVYQFDQYLGHFLI
jgi:hypothetical protein